MGLGKARAKETSSWAGCHFLPVC